MLFLSTHANLLCSIADVDEEDYDEDTAPGDEEEEEGEEDEEENEEEEEEDLSGEVNRKDAAINVASK